MPRRGVDCTEAPLDDTVVCLLVAGIWGAAIAWRLAVRSGAWARVRPLGRRAPPDAVRREAL